MYTSIHKFVSTAVKEVSEVIVKGVLLKKGGRRCAPGELQESSELMLF
jgi:hypothetical protein